MLFLDKSWRFTCMLVCALPLFASANEKSTVTQSSINVEVLTRAFDKIIVTNERPFYGVILLVQGGEPIYEYQQTIEGQNALSSASPFLLASQSKMITAAVVLKAVDDGALALNKPLNDYLAQANQPLYHPDITISQLLNHSSGIAPIGQDNRFTPGSQFHYSNLGYEVLAQVLAYQYQQPFAQRVNQYLGTHSLTGIRASLGAIEHVKVSGNAAMLAPGFAMQGDGVLEPIKNEISNALLPGGGMLGSAAGLVEYLQALHGGKLLSARSYQQMVAPGIKREHRWKDLYYGYGVQISEQSIVEYSHSGYLPGYQSLSLSYPESQTYLVVMENVSWPLYDMGRVFGLHDKLRNALREQLISSHIAEKINP